MHARRKQGSWSQLGRPAVRTEWWCPRTCWMAGRRGRHDEEGMIAAAASSAAWHAQIYHRCGSQCLASTPAAAPAASSSQLVGAPTGASTHLGIDHEVAPAGHPHHAQAGGGRGRLDGQRTGAGAQRRAQLLKQAARRGLGVALQGRKGRRQASTACTYGNPGNIAGWGAWGLAHTRAVIRCGCPKRKAGSWRPRPPEPTAPAG